MLIVRKLISLMKPLVERFPRIENLYRTLRYQRILKKPPTLTSWGFNLAGNSLMEQGKFEPLETEVVRRILDEVDVLVNVGANIGYYCCHALSMEKAVIAFEHIQQNLQFLSMNIRANNWSGVEIYPMALSNEIGILEIYGGDTGASIIKGWAGTPDHYVRLVPASTMDIVLGTRLQDKKILVLMDVEGAEKSVLAGANKMLSMEPKPIWMVEIMTNELQPDGVAMNPNFKSIFQLFFEKGYQAFSVDGKMSLVTMDQVDLILKGTLRPTTHNYIFCESTVVLQALVG
jgi:FkbM family methyltransferase